jgi:hypothetical protein
MAIHPKAALKILTRLRQLGWVKPSPWAGSWAATEEAEKLMIVEEVMTS